MSDRPGRGPQVRRRLEIVVLATLLLTTTSGCGWIRSVFGSDPDKSTAAVTESVFKVVPGECFNPPTEVKAELSDLNAMPCTAPHTQESYAIVTYQPPQGVDSSGYPGDAALASFANGACAQTFADYVGISYLDSTLFFTYLLPSARSWEQSNDRSVLCLVTTTGKPLTSTVKGSKL